MRRLTIYVSREVRFYIMGLFNKSKNTHENDQFALTRRIYPFESMFEYLCTMLAGGAFLAKLSMTLGVRDSITALISSIAYLVCVVQLFSGELAKHTPIKTWLIPVTIFTRVCAMGMFILPFLNINKFADVILLILVLAFQSIHTLLAPIKQTMFLMTVPENERTGYLARHNRVSAIAGIPLVVGGGFFIDKMTEAGKLSLAFLIIAIAILFFSLCNIVILLISKEAPIKKPDSKNMLLDFKKLFANPKFRALFATETVFGIGVGALSPFIATYVQREQGFSLMLANLYTMLQCVFQIIALSMLSKFRHRIKPTVLHTCFFVGSVITNAIFFVMNNDTALFFHFIYVLISAINSSAHLGFTSLVYHVVGEEERTTAVSALTLAKGVFCFITTLCISPFFDYMQTNGVTLFGKPIYAQRILAIVATVIMIIALVVWLANRKKFTDMDEGISFKKTT